MTTELPPGCTYTDHLIMYSDEAVEAVAHHLRLAALFWLSTDDQGDANSAEILRLIENRAGVLGINAPEHKAAVGFLDAMLKIELEQKDFD